MTATTVPSPSGGRSASPSAGTAPAASTPALDSSAASPRAASGERVPPSSTTGRPRPARGYRGQAPAGPRAGRRALARGVSTSSEVLRLGQRSIRAETTRSSRSVERVPGISCGASGSTIRTGRSSLREASLASKAASTPRASAARAATSRTRLRCASPPRSPRYGRPRSLRGRVLGVEDGEDHARVMPGGGEVRGGRRRQ